MTLTFPPTTLRSRMWILAFGALVIAIAIWYAIRPRGDREWIPEQAVLPIAVIEGDSVIVRNVRANNYTTRTAFTPAYADRTYDLSTLTSVWYVLTPFSDRWRAPAHSFVSFGFSDGRYLSISVEARRQPGEVYDVVKGLFKR